MDPAVVSCMMLQCDDKEDFQDLANGLQLEQKQIIFIPVNDNDHFGGGSSHWSLLIYHRDGNNYGNYDSSFGHNLNAAQNIARVFSRLLNINSETTADSSYAFESVQDAPQQHNGYDCGMYVLQIAEYFCRKWIDTNFQEKLSEFASPSRITSKRQEIPKLISTLVT
jgi:sentrin-specific protease 8